MVLKSTDRISQLGVIILSWIAMVVFMVSSAIHFYIAYEFLLIPMFYLIGLFGSRNQKLVALFEFYLYTLIGSLFLLIGLLLLYLELGSLDYIFIGGGANMDLWSQYIIFFCIFIGFSVKIPFVPVHLWLPKAHVEAPTIISVFLAAILLKLGTYGYIQFLIPVTPLAIQSFSSLISTICLFGILYTSLLCITSSALDVKKIIAYSSISHMNLAVLALFSNTHLGLVFGYYFLISHGIISSGLFFLIGVLYDRYHTRVISYYRGIVLLLPCYAAFFLLFTLGNVAFPFTSGFISEILTFLAIGLYNPYIALIASLAIILTPAYALFLLHFVLYGSWSPHLFPSPDLSLKEFHILFPLAFMSLLFGIFPSIITNTVSSDLFLLL
jgi:proton-translocating NADH-quinone oxidoreductase chain M